MSATATFPSISHPLPADPALLLPGGYLHSARLAVSHLATCRTLDDVVARFGTARHLAETVFGFPLTGGHATGPVVRTVGELLHHRLGPAVAAEALAMSVEVQHLVQSSTIDAVLRQYLPLASASAIPQRDETDPIVVALAEAPPRRRHALALRWCAPVRLGSDDLRWAPDDTEDVPPGRAEFVHWKLANRRSTYQCTSDLAALRSPGPERVIEVVRTSGAGAVRTDVLVALLTTLPVRGTGARDRLIDPDVVARLVGHPERRVVSALVPHVWPGEWPDGVEDALADIVASERDLRLLLGALQSRHPLVVATALDALARLGVYVPADWIETDRVAVAALLSPSLDHLRHGWREHSGGIAAVDHARRFLRVVKWSASLEPYRLPPVIRRLEARSLHPQREWTVRLLQSPRQLQANSEEMHNCTFDYGYDMRRGTGFVVAIDGPAGEVCNASIWLDGEPPSVTEVRAHSNEPAPEWMHASLQRLVDSVGAAPTQPRRRRRSARSGPRRPHRVRS